MKNKLFTIVALILISISLSSICSYIFVSDPQGKFRKIKRQFHLKESRIKVNFELPKDAYLLEVRHKSDKERRREIFFNGVKVTANIWPYKRKREDFETTYIHLPSEIVRKGKNAISITFFDEPPSELQIRLTNYRKQISEQTYILFSDSANLPKSKIFSKLHPLIIILFLSLSMGTYFLSGKSCVSRNRFLFSGRRYLLLLLFVLLLLFSLGWIISDLGYRVVVAPIVFLELSFIILAPFFVIELSKSEKLQVCFSKATEYCFAEQSFDIRVCVVLWLLIIVVNLLVYWPGFFHIFRHDEWFLFFSSRDIKPDLGFIIKHMDWQLKLPYDRLVFRPLHHTMLAINRVIFGPNYVGPHILTFIKHLFATFVLWQLMWQLSSRWISGMFALLFSVLLVGADTVMWPHIDAYIMTTIFTILAIIIFRRTIYNQISAPKGFTLTGLLLFFNILTTEIAFLMPFVFFCAYWVIFRNRNETALKQKDKASWLMFLSPLVLWGALFSIHLYFAYPNLKMTDQSDPIGLSMPFVNVGRFILVLLSGIFFPMLTEVNYGDKIYFRTFSISLVLLIVGTFLCIRIGRRIFKTITKESVFSVMVLFSITLVICFGRASYINTSLNDLELPSHYVYCAAGLIIFLIYAYLEFDTIIQSKKLSLPLLLILGFLTFDHAVRTRHSALDIERQTASLRKYFDSVRKFAGAHKKEPDFSFKIIDRPPRTRIFNWYHETCIDGLFCRYINNKNPKYLLEYDYKSGDLKYSVYNKCPEPDIASTVQTNIAKDVDYVNSIGMQFKKISGQEDDFLIAVFEVTQKQWKEVMGSNPSRFKNDSRPVENVSYYMVRQFIKRLNKAEGGNFYRLPTAEECSYLASFFASNPDNENLDRYAWLKSNSAGMTHPVGELRPMPLGLYDLIGNVWEWTDDPICSNSEVKPLVDSPRICFGGSWREENINLYDLKTSYPPDFRHEHLGFRLVREIGENRQSAAN